jgi:hypothetical protein
MMRTLALVLVVAAACKGETVVKPDPQTLSALDECKKSLAEKDNRISALQDENASLMRGSGAGQQLVVTIEGNTLTVHAGTNQGPPVDDKVAAAASKEFYNVVQKSRGAIQKCYEQALKKSAAPQGKTITLTVEATFNQAGQFNNSQFAPSLGNVFDECIQQVSKRWALPQNSPAMTFKAQVSLTPS